MAPGNARTKAVSNRDQREEPNEQPSFENLREKLEGNLKKIEKQGLSKSTQQPQKKTGKDLNSPNDVRGKKRTANGDVKDVKQVKRQQDKPHIRSVPAETSDELDLKAIIAELGGTEEDLELIENVDSESEVEGSGAQEQSKEHREPRKGKTLESGMANIMREIALVKGIQENSSSEDENEVKVNGTHPAQASKADTKPSRAQKNPEAQTMPNEKTVGNGGKLGGKHTLRCSPRPDWFNYQQPTINVKEEPKFAMDLQSVKRLHEMGQRLLEAENSSFKSTQMSSSSQAFYNTVIASGTLSDRISALTLAVQESPLHNMRGLENLLGLAGKRSRSQAVDVLRALKDLFAAGTLLPSNRKLNTFQSQPAVTATFAQVKSWKEGDILPNGIQESHLILWTFEHWLKDQFFEILKILESWANDEIEFAKARATTYTYELLKEKPEQEANLLRLLVNKLGDPMKKIASQASYLIMQLLATHPAMKEVVVTAIDTDFVFKPGQTTHGRYYAVITLNQTALSDDEEAVALKLLKIYFGLFKTLLKSRDYSKDTQKLKAVQHHPRQRKQAIELPNTEQEDELREKLISAILTGINRAYPYCGKTNQSFDEHLNTLFEITHSANFNTSVQALLLIQQLIATTSAPSERFYRTLYESLLDARLITSSKQQLYLNLLHRSLKADLNPKRIKSFVKRILQILSLQEPSFICGAFFLIKDLEKTIPSLATMIDQAEEREDSEETFKDVAQNQNPTAVDMSTNMEHKGYDPYKRAPEYAKADESCSWELLPYLAHFHPSVSVSAENMVKHEALSGKPDLNLHTLIHFLDRFVYKNAKLSEEKMRGSSIMQPLANDDHRAVLVSTSATTQRLPVNSEAFRSKSDVDVAAEDVFFHQYFKNLGKAAAKKSGKQRAMIDDAASFGSDEEDEVWRVMKGSARDIEGLEEDDQDDASDMSEFEAEMQGDESDAEMPVPLEIDDDDGSVDIETGIFDDSEEVAEDEDVDVAMVDDDEEEEFDGLESDTDGAAKSRKSKTRNKDDRERKKKLKALPTFASVADYAKLLDQDEDEDLG